MKKCFFVLGLVLFLTVLLPSKSEATEIFLWEHDNGLTVADQVLRATITATESVARTLNQLEIDYTRSRILPDDLSQYDVVMTCLSFYCPG